MAAPMVKKVCVACEKEFETNNDSDKCYNCTLEEITGGFAPEEGDFNTASIRSGTMTEQERAWLQQDLEAVENGTSSFEPDDDQEWLDWEEDAEDDQPTVYHTFECSVYGPNVWFNFELCLKTDGIEPKMIKEKQAEHDAVCNCGEAIKASAS